MVKYENLSSKEYFHMIGKYLRDTIIDHKISIKLPNNKSTSGKWKISLIMLNKCVKILRKIVLYIYQVIT